MAKPKKIIIHLLSFFFPTKKMRKNVRKKINTYFDGVRKYASTNKRLRVCGKNNTLVIIEKNGTKKILKKSPKGLKISVYGDNNTIIIKHPIDFKNSEIIIGDWFLNSNNGAYVELNSSRMIHNLKIICRSGEKQECILGKNTTVVGAEIFCDSTAKVHIGCDCMLSRNITIWGDDGHSILDKETHQIINKQKQPLTIGNNVWVGFGVSIMKNAKISDNSILGAFSVVGGQYLETNVIIAGIPAQIVKRNIIWDRRNSFHYLLQNKDNINETNH